MPEHEMAGDIASILVEIRALRHDVDNLRYEVKSIAAGMAVATSRQNAAIESEKKRRGRLPTISRAWL